MGCSHPADAMSIVPFDATAPSSRPRLHPVDWRCPPARAARLPLPEVLLCDLDGTLIDSMPTLADLATEVMEAVYGTPRILARELYLATCGLPFVKQLEEIFPGDARNADASASSRAASRPAATASACRPRRAAHCEQMRAWACASWCRRTTASRTSRLSRATPGFRSTSCSGSEAGWRRGAAHRRGVGKFGVDRQEMLFVGDSLHDGEIAEREGIPFVGVATTFSPERFALRFPCRPGAFAAVRRTLADRSFSSTARAPVQVVLLAAGLGQPPGVADRASPEGADRGRGRPLLAYARRASRGAAGARRIMVVGGFGFDPSPPRSRGCALPVTLVENRAFRDGNLVSLIDGAAVPRTRRFSADERRPHLPARDRRAGARRPRRTSPPSSTPIARWAPTT